MAICHGSLSSSVVFAFTALALSTNGHSRGSCTVVILPVLLRKKSVPWKEGVLCVTPFARLQDPSQVTAIIMYQNPAGIHPCDNINMDSPADELLLARHTVWGQNYMSKWRPTNGLCLAWPSAARLVDASAPPKSEFGTTTLLDSFESALSSTMQPNLWPSMDGGGVEQVGATQAVNDLLLQSVNGYMHIFPSWEPGAAVSFTRLRAVGAFVVSASRTKVGIVDKIVVQAESSGSCGFYADGFAPKVANGQRNKLAVKCNGKSCVFNAISGETYSLG